MESAAPAGRSMITEDNIANTVISVLEAIKLLDNGFQFRKSDIRLPANTQFVYVFWHNEESTIPYDVNILKNLGGMQITTTGYDSELIPLEAMTIIQFSTILSVHITDCIRQFHRLFLNPKLSRLQETHYSEEILRTWKAIEMLTDLIQKIKYANNDMVGIVHHVRDIIPRSDGSQQVLPDREHDPEIPE